MKGEKKNKRGGREERMGEGEINEKRRQNKEVLPFQESKVNLLNKLQILIIQVETSQFATSSKITLRTYNNMTKNNVVIFQEYDVTPKKSAET